MFTDEEGQETHMWTGGNTRYTRWKLSHSDFHTCGHIYLTITARTWVSLVFPLVLCVPVPGVLLFWGCVRVLVCYSFIERDERDSRGLCISQFLEITSLKSRSLKSFSIVCLMSFRGFIRTAFIWPFPYFSLYRLLALFRYTELTTFRTAVTSKLWYKKWLVIV